MASTAAKAALEAVGMQATVIAIGILTVTVEPEEIIIGMGVDDLLLLVDSEAIKEMGLVAVLVSVARAEAEQGRGKVIIREAKAMEEVLVAERVAGKVQVVLVMQKLVRGIALVERVNQRPAEALIRLMVEKPMEEAKVLQEEAASRKAVGKTQANNKQTTEVLVAKVPRRAFLLLPLVRDMDLHNIRTEPVQVRQAPTVLQALLVDE